MKRILLVARREFIATAGTKGFVIGLLIMPALLALAAVVGPRLISARSPVVRGEVAIVDATGRVTAELRATMAPAAVRERRIAEARRALPAELAQAGGMGRQAVERAAGQPPVLDLVERAPTADREREKAWLLTGGPDARRLALIVVHPDAVERTRDGEFGTYDLYASRALDDATEGALQDSMRQALINARLGAGALDRAAIEAMMRVPRPRAVIVSADGEQRANRQFTEMLPFIMGLLLFIGVIIGGQTLMTSMIEEKSSRVVEVLLAAVSPFELMAGKLLGQLGVGLLVLALYIGLGLVAVYSFAMLGLVDPLLLVYLLVFFLITYVVFGALMLSIGAAVSQVADAQSLMGPVMILLLIPYMLSPMIGRAPNSTFSVVVSFLPPINTIAMMARIGSEAPPPAWQIWLTALIGIAAAWGAVWFAAKVFKVGLLMHGKPPNFATLVRWARAA
jgi:ABC-2 type transport system permease protein